MTKLQNLYRAAIAADASVAEPGLSIDTEGRWLSEMPLPNDSGGCYQNVEDDKFAAILIGVRATIGGTWPADKDEFDVDDVCEYLERIARKEAK